MARDSFFRFAIVMTLPLVVAGAGCTGGGQRGKTREDPRVTVAHPDARSLTNEDEYNGWLVAYKTVDVRSRVRGHITEVHFKDGDIVVEGQTPLFDIDEAPIKVELAQAKAQAKALEAQEVFAKQKLEREIALDKQGAGTKEELDKAKADVEAIRAQINAKNAEADRIALDLKYAKIVAPLSGKIGKANLVKGDLVNAGGSDPVLATIVSITPIYVDFNVDERAIQDYQKGRSTQSDGAKPEPLRQRKVPFTFALDTDKGFPHKGTLVFADIKYKEGTGTILVRGEVDNAGGQLVPGSRVRVRIPTSEPYEAVLVPDTAVLSDMDRKYVLELGKDNIVVRRDITSGRLLDDDKRVVLPAAGEEVSADWVKNWKSKWIITAGLQRARVNDRAQPRDADGKPVDTKGGAQ